MLLLLVLALVVFAMLLTCFLDQCVIMFYRLFAGFFEDEIFTDKYSLYIMKNGYLGVKVQGLDDDNVITAVNYLKNDTPISYFNLL